jgi:hypothetical protein
MLKRVSSLIQPVYSTPRANAPISLGRSDVEITSKGTTVKCVGEACLRLQPRLGLVVVADLSGHPGTAMQLASSTDPVTLRYDGQRGSRRVLVLRSALSQSESEGTKAEAVLLPSPQRLTLCPSRRKRLKAVTFHVMNFPAFSCAGEDSTDVIYATSMDERFKSLRLGRAVLKDADWRIEIQELPNTAKLVEESNAEGGYGITHVGRLGRQDGRSFPISAAERVLRELHFFLSFARGLSVPLILPVGFDARENNVYENWNAGLGTPWEGHLSWFDTQNGQALAMLYPGFVAALRDSALAGPVSDALYWYLRSNRAGGGAGIDSGIILSQAALERLVSAYLAKAKVSSGSNTATRLRATCQVLKLPTAVPKAVPRLYYGRRRKLWKDAPDAIAQVRNELVHPKARLAIPLGRLIPDTWQLAQWYIELCILRLSNYRGVYSNRLRARWVGQVENVPWVRSQRSTRPPRSVP